MTIYRYYVASKVKHAPMWREFRDKGIKITSTWIDEAGEGETASYEELATRCFLEINRSDALVLYCEEGELLKGALIEVGAAMASGLRVFCVGDCPSLSRVFKKHPLWIEVGSVKEAFGWELWSD